MDSLGHVSTALIGKHLFGRPVRLAVCRYLARHDETYLQELAGALGQPQSAVLQELSNLVRLGLLRRNQIEGMRRVYYSKVPSPWWRVLETAADVADAVELDAAKERPS